MRQGEFGYYAAFRENDTDEDYPWMILLSMQG